MNVLLCPPQVGSHIVGTTKETYSVNIVFGVVETLLLRISQTTGATGRVYYTTTVVDNNGHQHRIAGTTILCPSLLTEGEVGKPLLGDDALEALLEVTVFPLDGNL